MCLHHSFGRGRARYPARRWPNRRPLTNSLCLKDRLRFHAKEFFLSFNPKGERFPVAGKRVRAKPWSGGAPTIITGTGKERKAYFSGTDWYLLVLDEPIGFEKGWIGVINTNGDIIQGHKGRNGHINRHGIDACKVNRNPLANLKTKTPPSNPPWWSVKETHALDSICLAGFPDKYFVAEKMTTGGNHDLIVSSNCFLRGRADDLIAHNCASSEGGSGSAMFADHPEFGPLIIAVHTGGFGVSMPMGDFFLRPGGYGFGHYNLAVSADRFFDAIVKARTDIEGKPPKLLRLGHDRGRQ